MPRGRPSTPAEVRFWRDVEKTKTCWLWRGHINNRNSYGYISVNGRKGSNVRVHRFSYALHYRPLRTTENVCHTCDVRHCVRPDHLFLGSYTDNMQDAATKGRMARGERHHNTKLTTVDVLAIRRQHAEGMSQLALASKYATSGVTIGRIVRRRVWKHV